MAPHKPTPMQIAESAAYLVAMLLDRGCGFRQRGATDELKDAINVLHGECLQAGLMDRYARRPNGGYDVWPEQARRYVSSKRVGPAECVSAV